MAEVTGPANPVEPTFTTEKLPNTEETSTEAKGFLRGLPGTGKRTPPKDTPPKRKPSTRRPAGVTDTKTAAEVLPDGALAKGISELYGQIGLFWGMVDPHCGGAIVQNAVAMGNSMEELAKESPAVRDFLQKMITTSVVGKVVAAHLPVGIAILSHHVPAIRNKFNPDNPDKADSGIGPNVKPGNAA